MEIWYLRDLHEGLRCPEHQVELTREGQTDKVSGRSKRRNKKTKTIQYKNVQEKGVELHHDNGVIPFTFTHHSVPVRSLLNNRLGPDDNVGRQSGKFSKMLLGVGFQAGLAAWEMIKCALHYKTRTMRGPGHEH